MKASDQRKTKNSNNIYPNYLQNNQPKTYFLLSENSLPYKFDFYMNGFFSYNNHSKYINETEKISRKRNLTLKDDEN